METKVYEVNEVHLVANLAKDGQIIAFPTETVYGLGVIYDDETAFNNLLTVKARDEGKPFTLMLAKASHIKEYAETNAKINKLIEVFLPGELTLLLKPKASVPKHVTRGSDYIGIRVSASLLVTNLISLIGKPLLVPSANKHNGKPALTSSEVYNVFSGEISAIIDGETSSHIPSTIIKVSDKIELVREGTIPFSELVKVWEEVS